MHNALIDVGDVELGAAPGTVIGCAGGKVEIDGEQITTSVGSFWGGPNPPSKFCLTNSILNGVSLGTGPVIVTANVQQNPPNYPFQLVDYGQYYLAANSPYRQAGTANISPRMLAELAHKTTSPPISFPSFMNLSGSIALLPQAPRYAGGAPDLGYYYDALDYSIGILGANQVAITIAPGTVVGFRNDDYPTDGYPYSPGNGDHPPGGLYLGNGSSVVSHGTPGTPIIFVDSQLVQEGRPYAYPALRGCWSGSEVLY